ncbi:DUF21 domain-containing protein At5g52790-like [Rhododendron vialii]|uniref:DUF21 domain-containing protein At5g52790-like n=1 Tax=Rhododendron vialii TaxID=182163 RepID=UPI00265E53F5|nr:DUF21 domain-containing protein At5g52790-like [Rhododendron vialii]
MREDNAPCCEPKFWLYLFICFVLVSFAGLMSGLSLGLLSFTQVDLEVLVKAGLPQDQKNAAKILPIVKNEYLLLCTLLVGKTLAMETLPIFLDSILPFWAAILVSVTLVLAFAEIIPQAVCSRYGLSFGAKFCVLVRCLLVVFFPVSYPFSKLLDWLMGKGHSSLLRRAELKTLVDFHGNEAGKGGKLLHHETTIISGALDMTQKTAKDSLTPISQTFSLDINSKLDMRTMRLVMSKGHSRIPIYSGSPKNIIGLVLVKNLIFCRPEDETPIKNMTIRRIPRVDDNRPLYDILNQFQKGHAHMAVVVKGMSTYLQELPKRTWILIHRIHSPFGKKEHVHYSTDASSSLYSSDNETQSPALESIKEQGHMHWQLEKWKQGEGCSTYEELESLPNNSDEEVVGSITMEDVMEELLQEEILDETDEYVDIHSRIKINLLPSRRSSSRSPGVASAPGIHWRTPELSPLSSYTPILCSPLSPYIQLPLVRPILYASPGKSIPNSPSGYMHPVLSSPSSHRVSRKPYERLWQPSRV